MQYIRWCYSKKTKRNTTNDDYYINKQIFYTSYELSINHSLIDINVL